MKYRVVQYGNKFYPQKKVLWWWQDFAAHSIEGPQWFFKKDDAIKFLQDLNKPHNDNVVYSE